MVCVNLGAQKKPKLGLASWVEEDEEGASIELGWDPSVDEDLVNPGRLSSRCTSTWLLLVAVEFSRLRLPPLFWVEMPEMDALGTSSLDVDEESLELDVAIPASRFRSSFFLCISYRRRTSF